MKRRAVMKKKFITILPFVIMPIFTTIYCFLDSSFLVDIFGCGCVPSTQTNMFNIPYNANDLRLTVFSVLTIALTIWGICISKNFKNKLAKIVYSIAVILVNVLLAMWVIKAFIWA